MLGFQKGKSDSRVRTIFQTIFKLDNNNRYDYDYNYNRCNQALNEKYANILFLV